MRNLKMESYDVVIVGAGIAGTGLAYNLKQICPEIKVLVIEQYGVGSHAGYGYRNTYGNVIEGYNLPYVKKFKGLIIQAKNHLKEESIKLEIKLDVPFYLVNYKEICKSLFERSGVKYSNDTCIKTLGKNKVLTKKGIYLFKFLVDCSGSNFFIRREKRLKMPYCYWVCKKIEKFPTVESGDYFTYIVTSDGGIKEQYPLGEEMIVAEWKFESCINPHHKKIPGLVIPCNPSTPMVMGNIAFLGDYFGNATTSAGEGIRPILETSKLLAKCIKEENLQKYPKLWNKIFLKTYLKHLPTRLNQKDKIKQLEMLKEDPRSILKILSCEHVDKETIKKFPKTTLLINGLNYAALLAKHKLYEKSE